LTISHLINWQEKEVGDALIGRCNVNKNTTREEFFQMDDRELARLGKPQHVVLKHIETSDNKPSHSKP
jgi:hypothetical protein